MSLPATTRNFLPQRRQSFAAKLSSVLQGLAVSTKVIARSTGKTPKAAERWLAGDNAMSAEALIQLCREFDDVWDFVCEQAGRDQSSASEMLDHLEALLKARRAA